jgi:hypothetical protein
VLIGNFDHFHIDFENRARQYLLLSAINTQNRQPQYMGEVLSEMNDLENGPHRRFPLAALVACQVTRPVEVRNSIGIPEFSV